MVFVICFLIQSKINGMVTEHRFHAAFSLGRKAYERVLEVFLTDRDMDQVSSKSG
jgi:hypothetical protein